MKPHVAVAAAIALSLGIFTSYLTLTPTTQSEQCDIISLNAVSIDPVPVEWIQRYNPALSDADAMDMYTNIEETLARYKADPAYQKGAARHITPRLFLALILKESSAHWSAISDHGAIGLCQVMPLHLDNLYKAGVIDAPDVEELLDSESNVRAGIHVLMMYARGVDTVERALCRYNGGPNKEWAGRPYARAVMKLYRKMGG